MGNKTPQTAPDFRLPTAAKWRAPRAVADGGGGTIIATADVDAPPERVFRALTTDEVERWWGHPDYYRQTDWKADLRVQGRWSVAVRFTDGSTNGGSGEFAELDAPRKIVMTRRFENHPLQDARETTITYRLDPIPTGTRVTVRDEGFIGRSAAAFGNAEHWERVLGWLGAFLGGEHAAAPAEGLAEAQPPTIDQFVSAVIAQFRSELRDPAMPFTLVSRFQIRDGTQRQCEAAFAEATTVTRKEPGVIAYELSRDAGDATRYVVYERWRSLSDLAGHLRTPYITSLIAALQGILARAPDFQVLIPAAEDSKPTGPERHDRRP